ncbi:MAG TPA: SMI1/KNR4 family protein [Firmicutes bacterium]|nr:SMI1/KNR4 family protein [Bacillota bacterium]
MIRGFGKTSILDIKEIEEDLKIALPKDYTEFLLENNGGVIDNDIVCFKVKGIDEPIALDVLYGINLKSGLNIKEWYNEFEEDLLEEMIIIGHALGSGLILLINQEDWKGIYFWDNTLDFESSSEEDCLYKISDSFSEFIDQLQLDF